MNITTKTALIARRDWFLAAALGSLSLALYVRTLAPWVLPGDSGEFQVLAYQLGLAHCPGYPIYLLLAKAFTLLPVGDIAYRVNLFSAFMAALAVAGVYLAARLLPVGRLAATFGALALAVGFTFWSHALIAEVYTAAGAFTIWIWVCVLGWIKSGQKVLLFFGGMLGGLSLGVHTTVVVFAPAVLLVLWLHRAERPGFWRPAWTGALTGLLLWVGIFLAIDWNNAPANIFNGAYATARSAWDLSQEQIENPLVRFWFLATAQQWRSALHFGLWQTFGKLGEYLFNLPKEFSLPTIALAVWGLAGLIRRQKRLAALLGAALALHWLVSFNYQIGDIYVFYLPGYVLLALLAASGFQQFGLWFGLRFRCAGRPVQAGLQIALLALCVGITLGPRLPAVWAGEVPFVGESRYLLQEDVSPMVKIAANTVEQMKPNAVVFIDWNWLYVYYYAAHIEQGRTDLRFIEAAPRADRPGLPRSVIDFIAANIDERPIYFSHPFPEVEAAGFRYQRTEIWYTTFFKVARR